MDYEYFFLSVGRERTAHKALADHLHGVLGPALVGLFSPVLGFASNAALVLARDADVTEAIASAPASLQERHRMTPTLRPLGDVQPAPGGVYVHNWFMVDAEAVDEFVRLSGEAWADFETRFEAKIFGLFLVEQSASDTKEGVRRLLLMTRYRDLGEWQASRDPTSEAMKVFARRRELTRVSFPRACQLIPRQ